MNALNPGLSPALQRLGEVSVRLSVELGRTDMPLRDVLALGEGSVVSLDRLTDELLDITANGQVIAYGEVIAQDGKFALRIVSLAGGDSPASGPPPRAHQSAGPRPDAPTAGEVPQPDAGASKPIGGANVDELTAALDETLNDAASQVPASGKAAGEKTQSDPLADALDDLPKAADSAAPKGPEPEQGAGE